MFQLVEDCINDYRTLNYCSPPVYNYDKDILLNNKIGMDFAHFALP